MNLTQLLDKLDLQEEEMKILIQDLNADQLNYEPLSGKCPFDCTWLIWGGITKSFFCVSGRL